MLSASVNRIVLLCSSSELAIIDRCSGVSPFPMGILFRSRCCCHRRRVVRHALNGSYANNAKVSSVLTPRR